MLLLSVVIVEPNRYIRFIVIKKSSYPIIGVVGTSIRKTFSDRMNLSLLKNLRWQINYWYSYSVHNICFHNVFFRNFCALLSSYRLKLYSYTIFYATCVRIKYCAEESCLKAKRQLMCTQKTHWSSMFIIAYTIILIVCLTFSDG